MESADRRARLPGKPVDVLAWPGDLPVPTFAELFTWHLADLQPVGTA